MIPRSTQPDSRRPSLLSGGARVFVWGPAVVMTPLAVTAVVMHQLIGRALGEVDDPALAATLRELGAWQLVAGGAVFIAALIAVTAAFMVKRSPTPAPAGGDEPSREPAPPDPQQMRELEALVAKRTKELETANAALAQQVEQLQGVLRAVSHDLAAPARNIDGMAKLLLMKQRDKLDDDAIDKLERIGANVRKQTAMISELIVRHRGRAARAEKQAADHVEVRAVIEDVIQTLRHEIDDKHIAVRLVGSFPAIRAERRRVEQVFQNLIDNAVKYMGQSRLRRITVRGEADLHFYRFAVEDTGPGIPWEDQGRLFDAYARTDEARASAVAGDGVGLSLVKRIAREHGGQVWVDSEPGKGATFHFTFAREVVSLPAAA